MKKTCFVLMGFGEKTDYLTLLKLDLDRIYRIIPQAVEECDSDCIYAVNIVLAHSPVSNKNTIYDHGTLNLLRPYISIFISEKQLCFPSNLNNPHITKWRFQT